MSDLASLRAQHNQFKALKLNLNMERGQPSDENFDLCLPMLSAVDASSVTTDSGVDIRNYPGGMLGLVEARELFCEQLGVEPAEIMVGNNSSLEAMSSILSWAMLVGVRGSSGGWITQKPKLIVTVPGYDRHFGLAAQLGYELVPVTMTQAGLDIEAVVSLAENDPAIKGIYFVPTYSNPTGHTLSFTNAERLVNVKAAAPDFTIFADDAYAVHHLVDTPEPAPNLLKMAQRAGLDDRVILFGSTSKVTFASGGLSLVGMSADNLKHWAGVLSAQSIGPNKAEQWRHVRFLKQYPGGLKGLMRDHANILKPKFDAVQDILNQQLGNHDIASWTNPSGGYFISLDTKQPIASRVVELAREAGVALTPTGATFPGGVDPDNRNIRLAPTRPPLGEVQQAIEIVACCVRLADAEYSAG